MPVRKMRMKMPPAVARLRALQKYGTAFAADAGPTMALRWARMSARDVGSFQPNVNEIGVTSRPNHAHNRYPMVRTARGWQRLEDKSMDEEPLHKKLQRFLQSRGLDEHDIEHALALLPVRQDESSGAPGGGPREGGKGTPSAFAPEGAEPAHRISRPPTDARSTAMDAAMRVGIDHPRPSTLAPPPRDMSERALAKFAARHPDAARIKLN
jgi:hypothetical protein